MTASETSMSNPEKPAAGTALAALRTDPEMLGECSLYIDLGDPFAAVAEGDWLATEAGSRYLVLTSRHVPSRDHSQRNRWRMRCGRLTRHFEIPSDVKCWWITWYPRRRSCP